jgi:hypothetical protein
VAKSTNGAESGGMAKSTKIAMIIGAIVIVALVAIVIVLAIGRKEDAKDEVAEEAPDKRSVVLTEENVENEMSDFLKGMPEGIPKSYTVTQNPSWEFPDGKSQSTNAYVENVRDNETPVYFDVVVDETGETVYSSPVLELGAKLTSIKLDKELAKGEYQCTMTYHLVDDKQNTLTTVRVGLQLVVLK